MQDNKCLENFYNKVLNKGELLILWVGQAGFLIKSSDGTVVAIDLYLTDYGNRIKGFKRISPIFITPEDLKADIYITTHHHFDHFDNDAIPIIIKNSPETMFLANKTCYELLKEIKGEEKNLALLEPEKSVTHFGVKVTAVYADHGQLAPDAVGLLIEIDENCIYVSGDTALRLEKWEEVKEAKPDIAILSINGAFGNLNSAEGAELALFCGAKAVIPCHFYTFAEHGGDPQAFKKEMEEKCPECKVIMMRTAEMILYNKQEG